MSFADGQCVGYLETFIAGDGAAGAYVCHLVITASRLELTAGGPLREMCTAAARDYPYVPPVAKQTAAPSKQFAKMGSGVKAGNPINPARLELWRQYLEKRGVQFLIGTPEAELKLYDNQADGLYSAGSLKKQSICTNHLVQLLFLKRLSMLSNTYAIIQQLKYWRAGKKLMPGSMMRSKLCSSTVKS